MLALQRYMMVSRDRQFPLSTPLSTLVTLLFIWLYTAGVSVPPLVGWGQYDMNTLRVRSDREPPFPLLTILKTLDVHTFGCAYLKNSQILFFTLYKLRHETCTMYTTHLHCN